MSLLCQLLPEDRDEPERLELLDAAIPASFPLRLLPCDQRALTADPPRRCVHLLPSPVRFTVLACARELFHAWVGSTEQAPVCVGGSLLRGRPLGGSGCRMR